MFARFFTLVSSAFTLFSSPSPSSLSSLSSLCRLLAKKIAYVTKVMVKKDRYFAIIFKVRC